MIVSAALLLASAVQPVLSDSRSIAHSPSSINSIEHFAVVNKYSNILFIHAQNFAA